MTPLKTALLTDGSSDKALVPIIDWAIGQHFPTLDRLGCEWSDVRKWQRPAPTLADKIARTVRIQLCDILFIHRDAEAQSPGKRREEIDAAIAKAEQMLQASIRHVCVIPVRMQEAWLLIDEQAIRRAANNPEGRQKLALPKLATLEELPDPKAILHELLSKASEYPGHRKIPFNQAAAQHRLAELIDDFSPLRGLRAFQQFEQDLLFAVSAYRSDLRP